jgi:hypothetical protein
MLNCHYLLLEIKDKLDLMMKDSITNDHATDLENISNMINELIAITLYKGGL